MINNKSVENFLMFFAVIAAWLPFFIEKIKKRKIYIKVLSIFANREIEYRDTSGTLIAKGMAYCLKITILTNKDMMIKKMNLKLKYPILKEEIDAIVFNGKGFTRKEQNGKYLIKVKTTDYIQNKPFYKKNEPYAVYLTFIINDPEGKIKDLINLEYIDLEFVQPNNRKTKHKINATEINSDDIIQIDYEDFVKIT